MNNVPRSDVGSGGIAGALTVILMLVMQGEVYDFEKLVAALAALITFGVPYLAPRYKSLAALITAPVAVLVSAMVGFVFFDAGLNKALVSGAISALVVALVVYFGRPVDPDAPAV